MERETGFEPATSSLGSWHSARTRRSSATRYERGCDGTKCEGHAGPTDERAAIQPTDLMATTGAAKPTSPTSMDAPASAVKKPAKKGGLKPDMATISGIALALTGIIGGLLLEKGSIQDLT